MATAKITLTDGTEIDLADIPDQLAQYASNFIEALSDLRAVTATYNTAVTAASEASDMVTQARARLDAMAAALLGE